MATELNEKQNTFRVWFTRLVANFLTIKFSKDYSSYEQLFLASRHLHD